MPIEITQNDKGRFYSLDGKSYPSVTTVLPEPPCPPNMTPTQWKLMLKKAADFGNIVHEGCAQIARGEKPDIDALEGDAEKIGLMLGSYWTWFKENVEEVVHVEEPIVNPHAGYGGTIDLIAVLIGDDKRTIIDIKTSSKIYPITKLQLAAYSSLTDTSYNQMVVRLKKEAPSKPPQIKKYAYERETDKAFLGLLEYYKFMNNGGK